MTSNNCFWHVFHSAGHSHREAGGHQEVPSVFVTEDHTVSLQQQNVLILTLAWATWLWFVSSFLSHPWTLPTNRQVLTSAESHKITWWVLGQDWSVQVGSRYGEGKQVCRATQQELLHCQPQGTEGFDFFHRNYHLELSPMHRDNNFFIFHNQHSLHALEIYEQVTTW